MRRKSSWARNHGGLRLPWFSIVLSGVAAALFVFTGAAPEGLIFDRTAIANGEWWRLLSGHLVHSDFSHALWDILAFALFGSVLEQRGRRQLVLATLISALVINLWLWLGMPELYYYCGLSGIINCLIVLLLIQLWQEDSHPLIAITALLFGGKLVVEFTTGQALFTATSWPSLPSVHIAGVVAALACITYWKIVEH